MRFACFGVAAAALATAVPVDAAVIVQTDNELVYRGFDAFDTRLGSLNKVTLSTSVYKSRVWIARLDNAVGQNFAIDWTVAGKWTMAAPGTTVAIDLVGAGTSDVTLVQGPVAGSAYGFFATGPLNGTGTFDLDPTLFTTGHILLNGRDPGFQSNAGDTSFAGPAGMTFQNLGGSCYVFNGAPTSEQADDLCGWVSHTLTYDYTPANAVPEPATWLTMILGFGAIGYTLRRRKVGHAGA
jgi:hypothetical protein